MEKQRKHTIEQSLMDATARTETWRENAFWRLLTTTLKLNLILVNLKESNQTEHYERSDTEAAMRHLSLIANRGPWFKSYVSSSIEGPVVNIANTWPTCSCNRKEMCISTLDTTLCNCATGDVAFQ